jgi:hypothetical protein
LMVKCSILQPFFQDETSPHGPIFVAGDVKRAPPGRRSNGGALRFTGRKSGDIWGYSIFRMETKHLWLYWNMMIFTDYLLVAYD